MPLGRRPSATYDLIALGLQMVVQGPDFKRYAVPTPCAEMERIGAVIKSARSITVLERWPAIGPRSPRGTNSNFVVYLQ
jgi:hypothetical protein